MGLSSDLLSQFVKVTNDTSEAKKESTVYGEIKESDGKKYIQIDGSSIYTPISDKSSASGVKHGDRVTATIKNHTIMINGNTTSPSVGADDVAGYDSKITELEVLIADTISADELNAEKARIDALIADNVTIRDQLKVDAADIAALETDTAKINQSLTAAEADISNLQTDKLDASVAEAEFAKIAELEATDAQVNNLEAAYGAFVVATTERLTAIDADISDLETNKLSTEAAKITYANIDFSNISKATMEWFYANSGLIENVVVGDGTITGNLVGVTIVGDLIEGNTIKADRLVIKGEDGLYYKLNTDGITTESEQTEYNSLNGEIITAKSITASKVNVSDLVAFDATIGGFHITDSAIYSEIKDSDDNVTRGIYMDSDGQINFGDESNFIKYYRDEDGTYKLAISAASILYSLNGKQYSIADLGHIGDYIHIGTYDTEPCIELGETDSDFRLIITNTRIMFMENSDVPAYINNQSLHIKKAVIEEEFQQGGFVWKSRSNGNLGLVWKGGTS